MPVASPAATLRLRTALSPPVAPGRCTQTWQRSGVNVADWGVRALGASGDVMHVPESVAQAPARYWSPIPTKLLPAHHQACVLPTKSARHRRSCIAGRAKDRWSRRLDRGRSPKQPHRPVVLTPELGPWRPPRRAEAGGEHEVKAGVGGPVKHGSQHTTHRQSAGAATPQGATWPTRRPGARCRPDHSGARRTRTLDGPGAT